MEHPLFRREVSDAPSQAWLGTVRLATPLSTQVWTIIAFGIASAMLVLGLCSEITDRGERAENFCYCLESLLSILGLWRRSMCSDTLNLPRRDGRQEAIL